jgi:hypothetical protein
MKEIKRAIVIVVEASLAVVAAVRNVHGHSSKHESRAARHAQLNGTAYVPLTKTWSVPDFGLA